MPVPSFLQPYLWSYDIKKLDPEQHKNLIITQVLNYGTMRAVRWLFKKYTRREIKEVLCKPRRGVWVKQSIDYWSKILDVTPDPFYYKFCLFDLNPNPKLAEEFFRSRDIMMLCSLLKNYAHRRPQRLSGV